jgi:AcrR family transcriptional regulator
MEQKTEEKIEQEVVKKRKVHSGRQKDKERTKGRLVEAVGRVLEEQGYSALTPPNIAREAKLDKKLVWTYFGEPEKLLEEYILHKDFWKYAATNTITELLQEPQSIGKAEISSLLQNQFEVVSTDKSLQKILHWELGDEREVLRKLADDREKIGEELFGSIMPEFEESKVDLRARLALLIGGIYYLSIHATSNGSNFCGIDINNPEGKERISKAIQDLVFEAYEKAGVKK